MKIDFEGTVRTLDLNHIRLQHAVTIQEFTGLPLADWQRALFSRDLDALSGTLSAAQAAEKATAYTDVRWIYNMAAAHWLMLAQNGEDVPLDGDYDVDIPGFTDALYTAALSEVKAKEVQDKPGPTARPGQRARPSRRTATPKSESPPHLSQLPRTGS